MKHQILRYYLDAYYPIIAPGFRPGTEILYVDGFAGPGFYTGDDEGSPIVALRAAYECERPLRGRFVFVEEKAKHHTMLCEELDRFIQEEGVREDIVIEKPLKGECEALLRPFIEARTPPHGSLTPAFFFLDQFGFTNVSMPFIRSIMRQPSCEVFVFLELQRFRATLRQDDGREARITAAFGEEKWKEARSLSDIKCHTFLRDEYKRCLQMHGCAKHVLDFTMKDHRDEIVSCLFHCTNNERGFEVMKSAMRRANKSGERSFSDRTADMGLLLDIGEDAASVADRLQREKSGVDLTFPEVKDFVMNHTQLVNPRPSLTLLEARDDLIVTGTDTRRQPGEYPVRLWATMRLRVKPKRYT